MEFAENLLNEIYDLQLRGYWLGTEIHNTLSELEKEVERLEGITE